MFNMMEEKFAGKYENVRESSDTFVTPIIINKIFDVLVVEIKPIILFDLRLQLKYIWY